MGFAFAVGSTSMCNAPVSGEGENLLKINGSRDISVEHYLIESVEEGHKNDK